MTRRALVSPIVAFACLTFGLASSVASAEDDEPASELERIARLVSRHRDTEALALLERRPPPSHPLGEIDYLRGRLLERLERFDAAAEAYRAARATLPAAARADAERRLAFALARAGRCDEARPALASIVAQPGDHGALARALAAECALAMGDLEAAAAELRRVAEEAAGPVDLFVVRLELADAHERLGDRAAAAVSLEAALRDRPGHPDGSRALERLRALGGSAPSVGAPEPLARAEAALRANRPADVLSALEEAPRPRTRAERAKHLHLEGMALYAQRTRYAEAATVLARAARLGGPDAVDDAFHAARAASRAGDDRRAIAAYGRLVRAHRDHPRAAQAAYLAAYLTLHEGGPRAHRAMERFLDGPLSGRRPHEARNGLWLLGFHFYERGRYPLAVRYLARYLERAEAHLDVARAHYWLGRSYEALGDEERARAALVAAVHHEPLGWYAQLAHARLAAAGVDDVDPFANVPAAEAVTQDEVAGFELPEPIALFVRLGLVEDALEGLRAAESTIRASSPRASGIEALHAAYALVGEVTRPFRLASILGGRFADPPLGEVRSLWEAAYPRPYRDVVTAEAERQGIPIEHVYATMRQESAFDPRAVSHAGAIGLLQLMPSTAERAAERIGLPFDRELLYEPAWNVRLGVAEMAALSARWGGRLPLVIAAYNAGSHRVKSWLEASGPIETDRFVERIPYDETRNYVRRVVGHFARYRYLHGGGDPWDVPIPQTVEPEVEPDEPTGIR
jgi:soluble lytic murein transglycosylase